MFTTRSLSSWVVLSSTTDLLILRHKIDYVTSLNVDFRREYHKNSVLPPYGRQQLIQDGRNVVDLGENISRSKTDTKFYIRLLYIVFECLSLALPPLPTPLNVENWVKELAVHHSNFNIEWGREKGGGGSSRNFASNQVCFN